MTTKVGFTPLPHGNRGCRDAPTIAAMASYPFSWIGQFALPRLTLLLNHIVSSEPVAMAKLQAHRGRVIDIRWVSSFIPAAPWRFVITPAGLFEACDASPTQAPAQNGLTITVHLPDPLTLAKQALSGKRPEVNIDGDAALAEVAAWMMKNLRWDVQDDVARVLGTAPAELLRTVGASISQGLQRWRPQAGVKPSSHPNQR